MESPSFVRPDLRQIHPGSGEEWCGHVQLSLTQGGTSSASARYTCAACHAVFEKILSEH